MEGVYSLLSVHDVRMSQRVSTLPLIDCDVATERAACFECRTSMGTKHDLPVSYATAARPAVCAAASSHACVQAEVAKAHVLGGVPPPDHENFRLSNSSAGWVAFAFPRPQLTRIMLSRTLVIAFLALVSIALAGRNESHLFLYDVLGGCSYINNNM